MFQKLLRKVLKIKVGLDPLPYDERDVGFSVESLFGISYKPKHVKKLLALPFEAKNQRFNTCGWVASTGAKEFDEKVELDEQVTVLFGKERGLISGDGFSNLRSNEMVVKEDGCAAAGMLNASTKTWREYSNTRLLTKRIRDNARKHRSKSFSAVYNTANIYKCIDNNRPVKIGVSWRSAMNMSGGFSSTWILNFIKGWLVGGHAMFVYGYNTEYFGKKVFRIRNSFGTWYGLSGDCYITEADLQKQIKRYGAFVNYDLDKDVLGWLSQHQGRIVKTSKKPEVYLIQGDKKRKYDDVATLYAHGRHDQDIITAPSEYLDEVKEGENIRFWDGGNVKAIKAIIQQKKNLSPIFNKYFKELFK